MLLLFSQTALTALYRPGLVTLSLRSLLVKNMEISTPPPPPPVGRHNML